MSDLKEFTKSTSVVYNGDFLDVRRDEVLLPNGKTGLREWINHPGAVAVSYTHLTLPTSYAV